MKKQLYEKFIAQSVEKDFNIVLCDFINYFDFDVIRYGKHNHDLLYFVCDRKNEFEKSLLLDLDANLWLKHLGIL